MRGPSPNVQRALGYVESHGDHRRQIESDVPCPSCKTPLRFDGLDPLRLGRVFQYCPSPRCDQHEPRPLERPVVV